MIISLLKAVFLVLFSRLAKVKVWYWIVSQSQTGKTNIRRRRDSVVEGTVG